MKKITLTLITILLPYCIIYGQIKPDEIDIMAINNEVEKIFESNTPITTKFLNAKVWAAKTFGDYKKVIQFEDEKVGKLILKGISKLPVEENNNLVPGFTTIITSTMSYTITIDVREEKYRMKIEDINTYSRWETNVLGKIIDTDLNQKISEFCGINASVDIDYESRKMCVTNILCELFNTLLKEINNVDNF